MKTKVTSSEPGRIAVMADTSVFPETATVGPSVTLTGSPEASLATACSFVTLTNAMRSPISSTIAKPTGPRGSPAIGMLVTPASVVFSAATAFNRPSTTDRNGIITTRSAPSAFGRSSNCGAAPAFATG